MPALHFIFLVEEESMEVFLDGLLPRLLPENCTHWTQGFSGKHDLLKKLESRLRAYQRWLLPDSRIVVLIDQDDGDCRALKRRLNEAADRAGFRSPPTGGTDRRIVNRIVIEELEAWYFGDWDAVRAVFPRVSAQIPMKARFRDPDAIRHTWEAFEAILQNSGYFKGGMSKIQVARAIGAHLDPQRCRSRSFRAFRDAIHAAVA